MKQSRPGNSLRVTVVVEAVRPLSLGAVFGTSIARITSLERPNFQSVANLSLTFSLNFKLSPTMHACAPDNCIRGGLTICSTTCTLHSTIGRN